jgi:hypothetical protein
MYLGCYIPGLQIIFKPVIVGMDFSCTTTPQVATTSVTYHPNIHTQGAFHLFKEGVMRY